MNLYLVCIMLFGCLILQSILCLYFPITYLITLSMFSLLIESLSYTAIFLYVKFILRSNIKKYHIILTIVIVICIFGYLCSLSQPILPQNSIGLTTVMIFIIFAFVIFYIISICYELDSTRTKTFILSIFIIIYYISIKICFGLVIFNGWVYAIWTIVAVILIFFISEVIRNLVTHNGFVQLN